MVTEKQVDFSGLQRGVFTRKTGGELLHFCIFPEFCHTVDMGRLLVDKYEAFQA